MALAAARLKLTPICTEAAEGHIKRGPHIMSVSQPRELSFDEDEGKRSNQPSPKLKEQKND